MNRKLLVTLLVLAASLMLAFAPLRAQDEDLLRNPRDLAKQLLDYKDTLAIPPPTPLYAPGDSGSFWVAKRDTTEPTQITAAVAAVTPNLYLWVEDGLTFDETGMQDLANQLDITLARLRNDGRLGILTPGVNSIQAAGERALPLPDVDRDPHLFILYARDLWDSETAIYNPLDAIPIGLAPGDYSNQHELIVLNTNNLPDIALHDFDAYGGTLSRAFYDLLASTHNPSQDLWLRDALNWRTFRDLQVIGLDAAQAATAIRQAQAQGIATYLQSTGIPLNQQATLATTTATLSGQGLFFDYLEYRYPGILSVLPAAEGQGLSALDGIFERFNFSDPRSGSVVTGRDLFADFLMANAINNFIGDGRYVYPDGQLPDDSLAASQTLTDQFEIASTDSGINQYGAIYLRLETTTPRTFTLEFDGQPQSARLPLPADSDPDNHFYWSGHERNRQHTLSREFDLSALESATLEFDVWHDLADTWNYAYVSASTDDGATWKILPPQDVATNNVHGLAYGVGFTGVSNPEAPGPWPFLGVTLNGLSIGEITPGEPASRTDLQPGDVIAGYDGDFWPGEPNLFALLEQYRPGDTLNLYIQRGTQLLDIPIELGEHPTRVFSPPPIWMPHSIDLSDYAGEENLLLRFEYISLPSRSDSGVAVDNIRIPELNLLDDAESEATDWTQHGWQRVDNRVPQEFLLQTAILNPEDPAASNVRHLIGPHDTATVGSWPFSLNPGETFLLSVAGLNENTAQPGLFDLFISEGLNTA